PHRPADRHSEYLLAWRIDSDVVGRRSAIRLANPTSQPIAPRDATLQIGNKTRYRRSVTSPMMLPEKHQELLAIQRISGHPLPDHLPKFSRGSPVRFDRVEFS